jgi:hypothetical protein
VPASPGDYWQFAGPPAAGKKSLDGLSCPIAILIFLLLS